LGREQPLPKISLPGSREQKLPAGRAGFGFGAFSHPYFGPSTGSRSPRDRARVVGPPEEAPWTPCLPGANPQTEPTGPARRINPEQGRWLQKSGSWLGEGKREFRTTRAKAVRAVEAAVIQILKENSTEGSRSF